MKITTSQFLVSADKQCDKLPFISTATNIVALVLKSLIFPLCPSMQNSHYYTHLQEKNWSRCVILLFPFIGNLYVALFPKTKPPVAMASDLPQTQEKPSEEKQVEAPHNRKTSRTLNLIYEEGLVFNAPQPLPATPSPTGSLEDCAGAVFNQSSPARITPEIHGLPPLIIGSSTEESLDHHLNLMPILDSPIRTFMPSASPTGSPVRRFIPGESPAGSPSRSSIAEQSSQFPASTHSSGSIRPASQAASTRSRSNSNEDISSRIVNLKRHSSFSPE